MSEWRSACVTAPYPPELLPNTPRRPLPPHLKRCSIAGSISCSRKSSQAPIEAELIYWLPPSRVKQSGKATTTGGMRCSPIIRSSRSGRFSRKPTQFVWDRPLLVKPTRSTSNGNPCPSCPAGTYTSTTGTDGSPSMLLLRAWLSIVTRLTEPIDPKNLRMLPTPAFCRSYQRTSLPAIHQALRLSGCWARRHSHDRKAPGHHDQGRRDGDVHLPSRAQRTVSGRLFVDGRTRYSRGAQGYGAPP